MSKIRILEEDSNKRGDLFGRLIGDLFLSLGYENPRLNIHKSGREIDVDAIHRMEKRRIIAECKATQDKIGGADINKFVGSLNAEQIKEKSLETIGYYVSLSGFRETAIEQEKELGFSRVIMLDWNDIVKELVKGKIIISPEKAVERAGRCASTQPSDLVLEKCELLAHSVGWIWAIYYSQNKQNTTFCLVHADGEVLSKGLYESIVEADKKNGGELHSLNGLLPFEKSYIDTEKIEDVKRGYFKYLLHECGDIRLDGLPADGEIGSRRLNLESIFVPLHLVPLKEYTDTQETIKVIEETGNSGGLEESNNLIGREKSNERKAVGDILGNSSRLTILAGPGGGKSTLLKRIAISYAFPERKELIDDQLPVRPWFPLFIRCRQLDFSANTSIMDILLEIPHRAEIGGLTNEFGILVNQVLQNGSALILVDGLDEIADESLRVAFVHQLRVFLATYPKANIVITSRKAGFRIIGGALIPHCKHYELAEFDYNDVERLTISWHKEVVGDNQDVYVEARKLATSICNSYRLMNLAKNPLLLTTLLLVKRWVGQLPTRRSVLYGKAIEVLLMTWNVEGHEPLDQEEVIPQLSYVAYSMMLDGVQSISLKRLKELLISARKQMPEILGYTKMSVQEMIDRVESRSSLLVLNGHEIENGTLYPIYEFQHLTFQEYLASKAIVEGYYLNQSEKDTLWSLLQPHLKDETWKEVIALAAVLSGRKVQPVVKELLLLLKEDSNNRNTKETVELTNLLLQCILDEIQISPDLLQECFEWLCIRWEENRERELTESLLHSKYRDLFIKTATDLYFSSTNNILSIGVIMVNITKSMIPEYEETLQRKWINQILSMLYSEDLKEVNKGLLASMEIFYRCQHLHSLEEHEISQEDLNKIRDKIFTLVHLDDTHVQFGSLWALSWCFYREQSISSSDIIDLLKRVIELWKYTDNLDVEYVLNWLITKLPISKIPKDYSIIKDVKLQELVLEKYSLGKSKPINIFAKDACFVLGFYCENEYLKKACLEENGSYLETQGKQTNNIKDIDFIIKSLKEEFEA
ncbi:NACHT domain-containing protein [Bacillus rhizoplanae]|uniref:NACHT domain-containing protein n=1 Tax=Bacillus rhizoplanae TaxID=2880966 RepID=UPI003D1B4929